MTTTETIALTAMLLSNAIAVAKWFWEAKQKKASTERALDDPTKTKKPRRLRARDFWAFFLAITSSMVLLTIMAFSSGPVTRLSVASIAFAAALVCTMFLALVIVIVYQALSELQSQIFAHILEVQREGYISTSEHIGEMARLNTEGARIVADGIKALGVAKATSKDPHLGS